jgi:hypothetical protein
MTSTYTDKGDSRDWARRVMRRKQAGEAVSLAAHKDACLALGLLPPVKSSADILASAHVRAQLAGAR